MRELQDVVIRFSGDSGDGMQLTGTLFSDTSALMGNGISTFPDYPAEIRAPQGTVAGVSGFQVHFGNRRELNPGDYCDVLIAMNPAALKANRKWLKAGATVILDGDSVTEEHLKRAGFETTDFAAELKLDEYNLVVPDITSMTREALKETGLDNKAVAKCKNMFALGICFWMFDRPEEHALEYIDKNFEKRIPLWRRPTSWRFGRVMTTRPIPINSPIPIGWLPRSWKRVPIVPFRAMSLRLGDCAQLPRKRICRCSAARIRLRPLRLFWRNWPSGKTSVSRPCRLRTR